MTAVPHRQALTRRRFSTRHVALAVGALALSLSVPAQASSSDGVKPGTGGAPSDGTAGVGGNGGGQGGSAAQSGAKNPGVNGKGGDGVSGSSGIAAGGAAGMSISSPLTISSTTTGGSGAAGRVGQPEPGPFHGMSGGGGGAGAFVSGSRQVTIGPGTQVSGGAGGNGANGRAGCTACNKGAGGGGGDGIVMIGGGTLTNEGVIRGGVGGEGVTGASTRSSGGGGGGHGVEGANLVVINAGTIGGGAGGLGGDAADGGESGAAIRWTGGTNALRVQGGSVLQGALWVGSGATVTISADVAGVSLSNWLLIDGSARIDTAAQAIAYRGPITGAGSLTKASSGILTLSGTNTFSGGLNIQAGEVRGQAGSLGTGAIRDDGTLRINQTVDATLKQAITGTGTLIKEGAAQLTLIGNAQFSGTFQIDGGELAIGPEGTLSAGGVRLNGAGSSLDLSASTRTTTVSRLSGVVGSAILTGKGAFMVGDATEQRFDGTVDGVGGLTKQGAGSLTLTGHNTYTGRTTINSGSLVGSVDSFGTGDIVDNGVLRLVLATDAALANTVSGSGLVEKTGAGQLSLPRALTHSGGLSVLDGRVAAVDQQFLGSGKVSVSGPGQIALSLSADTQLRHIGGDGLVAVDLADTSRRLTMSEVPAGLPGFAGTLALSNGSLALSGAGAEALSAGTLQLNTGGRLLAETDTGSIGALKMNDGSIRFTPSRPDDTSTLRPLQINRTLDLSGSGTVQVALDLHGSKAADSMGSLLARDEGVAQLLARIGPGGQVIGDAAGFRLAGGDGQAVGDSTDGEVVQNGQRVATTTTRYGLSAGTGHDGLYLTSRLLAINVLADRELMLIPSNGATGASRDLSLPISGAGSIAIDAGEHGTISLSSPANVYAGGTRIVSGTLALTGGSLPDGNAVRFDGAGTGLDLAAAGRPQQLGGLDGSAPSSIVQLGRQTLTLALADDHAFAGAIAGTGALVKTGAGTLTLTGTSDYSGGTTISGGTLAGRAGSLGSGAIRNDATLVVDQAADGELPNDLSGGGTVIKRGDGALTLRGANTGSGALRIEAGTLRADVDRLGTGAVVNEAVLELDVPRASLLDARLSGSGRLVKSGPGDLRLEGAQSVGLLSVRSGGLVVGAEADGGALLRGDVDLAPGTRLQGSGTIAGSARLAGDASLQLKSASAALRVRGDLGLAPGVRVTADLDATSRQPLLIVDGKLSVQGALLHVNAKDGDWAPDTRIDLLRAGQVEGRFAAVDTNLAFLTPTLEYGSQDVIVAMKRNQVPFATLAQTPNQQQVADALTPQEDRTPAAGLIVKLPREEVAASFESLAGSSKASAVAAPSLAAAQQRLALGRHLREALTLRSAFDDGSGLWATAFQQRSALVAEQVSTARGDLRGGLAGIDLLRGEDLRLGVAVGDDRQTLGIGDLDRVDVRSALFSLYGAAHWQLFQLRGALSYARSRIHTGRDVVVGQYRASLSSDERARHAEGFVEVGLPGRLPFGQIEPFVQVGRFATRTSGFAEQGDDTTALSGAGVHDARAFGMAGLHWATGTQVALGAGWRLQGTAAVQHVGGAATVSRRVRLAGTDSFVTSAASGAGTGMLVDLGLAVTPRPRMALALHVKHGETGASRDNGWRVQGSWQF